MAATAALSTSSPMKTPRSSTKATNKTPTAVPPSLPHGKSTVTPSAGKKSTAKDAKYDGVNAAASGAGRLSNPTRYNPQTDGNGKRKGAKVAGFTAAARASSEEDRGPENGLKRGRPRSIAGEVTERLTGGGGGGRGGNGSKKRNGRAPSSDVVEQSDQQQEEEQEEDSDADKPEEGEEEDEEDEEEEGGETLASPRPGRRQHPARPSRKPSGVGDNGYATAESPKKAGGRGRGRGRPSFKNEGEHRSNSPHDDGHDGRRSGRVSKNVSKGKGKGRGGGRRGSRTGLGRGDGSDVEADGAQEDEEVEENQQDELLKKKSHKKKQSSFATPRREGSRTQPRRGAKVEASPAPPAPPPQPKSGGGANSSSRRRSSSGGAKAVGSGGGIGISLYPKRVRCVRNDGRDSIPVVYRRFEHIRGGGALSMQLVESCGGYFCALLAVVVWCGVSAVHTCLRSVDCCYDTFIGFSRW